MDNNKIKLIAGIILAIVGRYLLIRKSNPMGGLLLVLGMIFLGLDGYNNHKSTRT